MSKQIRLSDLSPEAIEELKQQALAEEKDKANKVKEERKAYKSLVDETLPELFKKLVSAAELLGRVKQEVFTGVQTLVKMKSDVYEREDEQHSHSFTTGDGLTIIIGHRMNDGWDDTVNVGVQKVHDFLDTLGTDKKSKDLVKAILQLLSKDSKGTLKASRVLQLKKIADDMGDAKFIDAITIIQDAYRPTKSKEFVTARYTGADGVKLDLPLDITSVDMDFKYEQQKEV